jgi:hypothetical protein
VAVGSTFLPLSIAVNAIIVLVAAQRGLIVLAWFISTIFFNDFSRFKSLL